MNKIIVVNDKTEYIRLNKKIDFSIETYDSLFSITNIKIEISGNEDIYFFIKSEDKKYKINIDIDAGISFNIYIFENVLDSKIQYSFSLSENAHVNIMHFNKNTNSRQMLETNLIGANTDFKYVVRKICDSKETSDFYIHHCGNESKSDIGGEIVSRAEGVFSAQISTFVEEECVGATTIQNIIISKYRDGKTEIKPNLYIDNNTATINHNNSIKSIDDFIELDFMINDLDDKKLKQEIIKFIKEMGE